MLSVSIVELIRQKRCLFLVLGFIFILTVVVIDLQLHFAAIRTVLEDGLPLFDSLFFCRSAFILLGSISFFLFLLSFILSRKDGIFDVSYRITNTWLPAILAAASASLIVISPASFVTLALEDSPVEQCSALLLFLGCLLTLRPLFRATVRQSLNGLTKVSLLIIAFAFFVTSMEEISWFQRILEVETPEFMEANMQGELNLHNFATYGFELVYYTGCFVLMVLCPALRLIFPVERINFLNRFIPDVSLIVVGSIPHVFNFSMWNHLTTQVTFFWSLTSIGFLVVIEAQKSRKVLLVGLLLLCVASQGIFLVHGSVEFERRWDISEFKEFFLALSLFFYGVQLSKIEFVDDQDVAMLKRWLGVLSGGVKSKRR